MKLLLLNSIEFFYGLNKTLCASISPTSRRKQTLSKSILVTFLYPHLWSFPPIQGELPPWPLPLTYTHTDAPPPPPNMPLPSFALSHSIENPLGVWRYSSRLICLSGQVKVRYTTFCFRIFKNKKQNTHTQNTSRTLETLQKQLKVEWLKCPQASNFSFLGLLKNYLEMPCHVSLRCLAHCRQIMEPFGSWWGISIMVQNSVTQVLQWQMAEPGKRDEMPRDAWLLQVLLLQTDCSFGDCLEKLSQFHKSALVEKTLSITAIDGKCGQQGGDDPCHVPVFR